MIDDLHTTSTGQSTHQDSVKKILSATQFVTEVLPAEHSFHKKVLPAAHLFDQKILSVGQCIWCLFWFTNSLVPIYLY